MSLKGPLLLCCSYHRIGTNPPCCLLTDISISHLFKCIEISASLINRILPSYLVDSQFINWENDRFPFQQKLCYLKAHVTISATQFTHLKYFIRVHNLTLQIIIPHDVESWWQGCVIVLQVHREIFTFFFPHEGPKAKREDNCYVWNLHIRIHLTYFKRHNKSWFTDLVESLHCFIWCSVAPNGSIKRDRLWFGYIAFYR